MEYQLKGITSEDLEKAARELLEQLKSDEKLRQEARSQGVDVEKLDPDLRAHATAQSLEVEPIRAGLDPFTVTVLVKVGVAFAPVAATVMKDCWTHFLLPRLRRRFGADAIKSIEEEKKK